MKSSRGITSVLGFLSVVFAGSLAVAVNATAPANAKANETVAITDRSPEKIENVEATDFSESVLAARNPAGDVVVSGSVQARKRYPGGADEDDLQVQAVLPNPSRGLEAHDAAVSEAAAGAGGEAPASD